MLAIEPPDQFKDLIDRDRKRKREQSNFCQDQNIIDFSTQFVDKLIQEVLQTIFNRTISLSCIQCNIHSLERQRSNDVLEKKSTLLIIDKSKTKIKKPKSLNFHEINEYLTTNANIRSEVNNNFHSYVNLNNNNNDDDGNPNNSNNNKFSLIFRPKKLNVCQSKSTTADLKLSNNHHQQHTKRKLRVIRQIFSNWKNFSCRPTKNHTLDSDTDKADDEFQFHQMRPLNQWNRNYHCPKPLTTRQLPSVPHATYSLTVSKRANFDIASNIDKVKECGYYWGPISCKVAEKLLANEPEGSFLLRDSNDDHYIFSLTIKFNNYVSHVRISHNEGNFSFGSWTKFKSQTIVDFIQSAIDHSRSGKYLFFIHRKPIIGPIRVQLLHPISRFKQVQSLQHLCRFKIVKIVRKDLIHNLPLPKSIINYLNENQYFDDKMQRFNVHGSTFNDDYTN